MKAGQLADIKAIIIRMGVRGGYFPVFRENILIFRLSVAFISEFPSMPSRHRNLEPLGRWHATVSYTPSYRRAMNGGLSVGRRLEILCIMSGVDLGMKLSVSG